MNQDKKEITNGQPITEGLFDEPIETYHATRAIGSTHLRTWIKSKDKFWHLWNNPQTEQTESVLLGSALHCAVLEPEEYLKRFVKAPEINRRTNAGKAEWESFCIANKDKGVLKSDQWDLVDGMAASVGFDPRAKDLLEGTHKEKSARVRLSNNILAQCRPDAIKPGSILDVKTCQDINRFPFEATRGQSYHIQAAFYYWILSSINPDNYKDADFYFIAVEKTPPYVVGIYGIDNVSLIECVDRYVKPALLDLGELFANLEEAERYLLNAKQEMEWLHVL